MFGPGIKDGETGTRERAMDPRDYIFMVIGTILLSLIILSLWMVSIL